MSIDLVIGGDHGKAAFIVSINIKANFTPGRNITIIFSLAHVQCRNYNGDIIGNKVMSPI